MLITPHFSEAEFSSPTVRNGETDHKHREAVPPEYMPAVRRLCAALEVIREANGGTPIRVVSGWRSVEFNRRNKGRATQSQHLFGRAADLSVAPEETARLFWTIDELMRSGQIKAGGLAYYPGRTSRTLGIVGRFIHYDQRGYRAHWKPNPPRVTVVK